MSARRLILLLSWSAIVMAIVAGAAATVTLARGGSAWNLLSIALMPILVGINAALIREWRRR